MREPISWDEYWIKHAELVAERSKDPDTQVGAVAIDPDNRLMATGYNGFPRGIKDTPERWKRPTKYIYVVHAEDNIIANAVRTGAKLAGCTLYITIPPCTSCAKKLIQSGIVKVIYRNPPNPDSTLEYEKARDLFKETGVELVQFSY